MKSLYTGVINIYEIKMLTKHYHAFILLFHIHALHMLALAINFFHEKSMAIILSRPEQALLVHIINPLFQHTTNLQLKHGVKIMENLKGKV